MKKAFTLAEALVTLMVISIIAAMTIPSFTAEVQQKAWKKQHIALYSKMAQALSAFDKLNGYGADDPKKASDKFVVEGLSKIYKLNSVCNIYDSKACGIPETMTLFDGKTKINFPKTMKELNPALLSGGGGGYGAVKGSVENTNAAFFTTINGDSVAAFYNPECGEMEEEQYNVKNKMCVNFIVDVNGVKGPNKLGKDMGIMTAFFSDAKIVAAPVILNVPETSAHIISQSSSDKSGNLYCEENGGRVPTIEELGAIYVNSPIYKVSKGNAWSSTRDVNDSYNAWLINMSTGDAYSSGANSNHTIHCVEKIKL